MGIGWRIVLLAGTAVAVAVIAATVGSYLAVRGELISQIDDSLRVQAEGLAAAAENGAPKRRDLPRRLPGADQAAPPSRDRGVRIQLLSRSGAVEKPSRTGAVPVSPGSRNALPVGEAQRDVAETGQGRVLSTVTAGGEHFRTITVGVGQHGAVMLGRSLDGVEQVLSHLRLILALLAVGGIGLAAALALLLARRISGPIADLTDAAEHISATRDLGRRIEVQGRDEVARLARRFNDMLETIDEHQAALGQSVTSQRQLVADASHELRTPVAAIRTDIEALLAHPDLPADERLKMLAAADERIEELTELILDLIELARGDENIEAADEVRLDLIVNDSIVRLRRMAPERQVDAVLAPTVVRTRPDRLYRAVNNLLDNADKYSAADQPIEITVDEGAVEVRDHGPGIPEADLPRLFDRFWRGSSSRHRPGSGLGLAIVRQVADAGDGTIDVLNLDRGGAAFRLRFPVVEDANDEGHAKGDGQEVAPVIRGHRHKTGYERPSTRAAPEQIGGRPDTNLASTRLNGQCRR